MFYHVLESLARNAGIDVRDNDIDVWALHSVSVLMRTYAKSPRKLDHPLFRQGSKQSQEEFKNKVSLHLLFTLFFYLTSIA